jgi:hypothetical protein
MIKHNPFHYKIVLSKITFDEALRIRKYLHRIGYEEDDFEYYTDDYN